MSAWGYNLHLLLLINVIDISRCVRQFYEHLNVLYTKKLANETFNHNLIFQVMWIPEMMYSPDQLTDPANNREDLKLLYDQ